MAYEPAHMRAEEETDTSVLPAQSVRSAQPVQPVQPVQPLRTAVTPQSVQTVVPVRPVRYSMIGYSDATDELDVPTEKKPGFLSGFAEIALTLALGLALALLLRAFVVESYVIPSGSMLNTLQLGDRLLGEKISYYFRDPEPGEIVTFWHDDGDGGKEILIKRVIAVAGQTVDLVDGNVYVDGMLLDEPYTGTTSTYSLSDSTGSAGIVYPYTVPEGCVWVMGDNRTNSSDSRYFGPVSMDDVTSHAIFIFWPIGNSKAL